MGSVKDVVVLKKPTLGESGIANFIFSDRYSVFDWGEMPNHIANKGKALCLIGAYFFEKLEEMGIRNHYLGVVENEKIKRLPELKKPVNVMQVQLLQVLKPKIEGKIYDYSVYQEEIANILIPLEIIYRNSLPEGSSVFKRFQNGSVKPEDIGLSKIPIPGQKLDRPMLDVSTKLEATDRYITWEEAKNMAGLNGSELEAIKLLTHRINILITQESQKLDLYHEDGKVEFGIDEDCELMLVDILGTPDECRFTYQDIPVSKEAARIYYRNTPWYEEVEQAKKRDIMRWKNLVKSPPPPLPQRLDELIAQLYMAFCNGITGRDWFETPALKNVLFELKKALQINEPFVKDV